MLYALYELFGQRLDDWGIGAPFKVLDQLTFRALAAAALAFMLVILTGKPVINALRRKKIGDTGRTDAKALEQAAKSKANTPTMGGVIIIGAILISTGLLADLTNFYVEIGLFLVAWLAVVGGVDDWLKLTSASRGSGSRQGLFAWEKMVFQLGIGLLAGYFMYSKGDSPAPHDLAHVLNLPFQRTYVSDGTISESLIYLPRIVFIVFVILMITGMSNAANISDGMDGLAAGVTVIVSIGLVVLTYVAGWQAAAQLLRVPYVVEADELLVLATSCTGACLGFLWWNCSPAQVFMGDTGSLPLGGLLAYVACVVRQEVLLLFMSLIFLAEIASVTLQVGYFRYSKGKRLFKCAPYHHHLHISGWPEQQIVIRFWIVSALAVVIALASIKVR